jgi:hypothetical protein
VSWAAGQQDWSGRLCNPLAAVQIGGYSRVPISASAVAGNAR